MPRRKAAPKPEEPLPEAAAPQPQADVPAAAPPEDGATEQQRTFGPNPHPIRTDPVAGVRLQEDKRFRQMQIKFDVKPSDAIRQAVRDAGFQWRQQEEVWSKAIDREHGWKTRADAERLYGQVTDMIREDKGISQER